MQPSEEMCRTFWRHGVTVHMRIFELDKYRAIQWWYPDHSGAVYVPKNVKINPQFDGTNVFDRAAITVTTVQLPTIPETVDVAQFHKDVEQVVVDINSADILKDTELVSEMIELAKTASENELERKLAFYRAKQKLKVVFKFKSGSS